MSAKRKIGNGAAVMRALRMGFPDARVSSGVKIVREEGSVILGSTVIGRDVRIAVIGSKSMRAVLEIGDKSSIGDRTIINASRKIIIGDRTEVSWNCQILDTDFHQITFEDGATSGESGEVVIGRNVLIGTSSIILKNSIIEDNVVVGAGSLVTGRIESGWLAVGVPAKPIRRIRHWE